MTPPSPTVEPVEENKRYNYLTVLRYSHSRKVGPYNGQYTIIHYWLCRCDCGTERPFQVRSLTSNRTKSCGCKAAELSLISKRGHGQARHKTRSRAYRAWADMKTRVLNPRYNYFYRYGGRGISICPRWLSFRMFYEDMGDCSEGMTLERIDNNGNYEPSNCKWIPRAEQANNKGTTIWVTINGQTRNVTQWARYLGVNRSALRWKMEKHGPEAGVRHYLN